MELMFLIIYTSYSFSSSSSLLQYSKWNTPIHNRNLFYGHHHQYVWPNFKCRLQYPTTNGAWRNWQNCGEYCSGMMQCWNYWVSNYHFVSSWIICHQWYFHDPSWTHLFWDGFTTRTDVICWVLIGYVGYCSNRSVLNYYCSI